VPVASPARVVEALERAREALEELQGRALDWESEYREEPLGVTLSIPEHSNVTFGAEGAVFVDVVLELREVADVDAETR
jgi:hypothetical protein